MRKIASAIARCSSEVNTKEKFATDRCGSPMGCGMRDEIYWEQVGRLAIVKPSGYKTPVHTEILVKRQKIN